MSSDFFNYSAAKIRFKRGSYGITITAFYHFSLFQKILLVICFRPWYFIRCDSQHSQSSRKPCTNNPKQERSPTRFGVVSFSGKVDLIFFILDRLSFRKSCWLYFGLILKNVVFAFSKADFVRSRIMFQSRFSYNRVQVYIFDENEGSLFIVGRRFCWFWLIGFWWRSIFSRHQLFVFDFVTTYVDQAFM